MAGSGSQSFSSRTALVTGASLDPSIGHATALRLARAGANVVINGRSPAALGRAEAAMRDEGLSVVAVRGDAEETSTCEAIAAAALSAFGRIDYVVNTVGGNRFLGTPMSLERAELRDTIELNTWAPLALIQAAVEAGLGRGSAVVNISSGTVHKTTPMMIAYAAGKSALNAMTKTLARDLAPQGIRVNAVAPGFTKTAGTEDLWGPDDGEAAAGSLPLGRLTEAGDIAEACAFLLSDAARQITGQIIDVDGGNHLMGGGFTPMTDQTTRGRSG